MKLRGGTISTGRVSLATILCALGVAFEACSGAGITYHQDAQRTGWDSYETALAPATVQPGSFGLVASTTLDDQVDTEPLVVYKAQTIAGLGVYTVAYVATEGNSVYAINGVSGSILLSTNLGTPVSWPQACNNNGPHVGINGTPTIDTKGQTLYVIAYVQGSAGPQYFLHALDAQTLKDKPGSPVLVTASHQLADGNAYTFNASIQRQRPALLQANGNIYAAFGSFCDDTGGSAHPPSRGWLLGWNATTLAPLAANVLTNTSASSSTSYFLSSIWMAGYGPAADASGNIFFVTANSASDNPPATCAASSATFSARTDVHESVVKVSGDLSAILDTFTPSNWSCLDFEDCDFGSGGVMLLPDQPGATPHMAVAAGKDGRMFVLNRDNLGGLHDPDIPTNVNIGGCLCGPSYFKGPDGVARVVTSGGYQVKQWKVNSGSPPTLALEASSSPTALGGSGRPTTCNAPGGFFTSISSDATGANAIIWAVGPPIRNGPFSPVANGPANMVYLYAFSATASGTTLPLLWSGVAGTWPYGFGVNYESVAGAAEANLVPTVSFSKVYVASYQRLAIFGRVDPSTCAPCLPNSCIADGCGRACSCDVGYTCSNGSCVTIPTCSNANAGQQCDVFPGQGACAGAGTFPCTGPDVCQQGGMVNGQQVGTGPLLPVNGFMSSPAWNGSWDWNCDGVVEPSEDTCSSWVNVVPSPGNVLNCPAPGQPGYNSVGYSAFQQGYCVTAPPTIGGGETVQGICGTFSNQESCDLNLVAGTTNVGSFRLLDCYAPTVPLTWIKNFGCGGTFHYQECWWSYSKKACQVGGGNPSQILCK